MLQDLSKPGSLVYLFAEVNILLERGNLNFFKTLFLSRKIQNFALSVPAPLSRSRSGSCSPCSHKQGGGRVPYPQKGGCMGQKNLDFGPKIIIRTSEPGEPAIRLVH